MTGADTHPLALYIMALAGSLSQHLSLNCWLGQERCTRNGKFFFFPLTPLGNQAPYRWMGCARGPPGECSIRLGIMATGETSQWTVRRCPSVHRQQALAGWEGTYMPG
jgi:hypothetical protein